MGLLLIWMIEYNNGTSQIMNTEFLMSGECQTFFFVFASFLCSDMNFCNVQSRVFVKANF